MSQPKPTLDTPHTNDDRSYVLIGLMFAAVSGAIIGCLITYLVMR